MERIKAKRSTDEADGTDESEKVNRLIVGVANLLNGWVNRLNEKNGINR